MIIDEKTQKELNIPLKTQKVADPTEKAFLENLVKLINEGKINLFRADTLINHLIYDKLPEDKQGKVDLEALNLLAAIREIKGLYDAGFVDTYQMENLVERLKSTKERLESAGGDLFII